MIHEANDNIYYRFRSKKNFQKKMQFVATQLTSYSFFKLSLFFSLRKKKILYSDNCFVNHSIELMLFFLYEINLFKKKNNHEERKTSTRDCFSDGFDVILFFLK